MVEYVFRQDGGIDVRAGSTGTTLNRGTLNDAEGHRTEPRSRRTSRRRTTSTSTTRIDFDVDGPNNRLVEENTRSVPSATRNAFVVDETGIDTEGFRDLNAATNRHWTVQSTTRENAFGHPTAYELVPGANSPVYSQPDFGPLAAS